MKDSPVLPPLKLHTFYSFVKMKDVQKDTVLRSKGILLDKDTENGKTINLYFLDGFFVEEIISGNEKREIIPFKQGYRIESYLQVKEVIVPRRSVLTSKN
jgi:hypothetical protein